MKTCKVSHCTRTDIKGCGFCSMHYQRYKKTGSTERTQTPKGFALLHPIEYRCYTAMKNRCTNKNNHAFCNYGGRGINICERWLGANGFLNFFSDMGERPSPKHSLDRIDVNGDYEPTNCRWADAMTQCNNRRTNKKITFQNETLTEAEWAQKIGVKRNTLHERLRRGMPIKKALTMKKQEKKGELYRLAKAAGADRLRAYKRLQRGWSLDDALHLPPQPKKSAP